MNMKPNLEAIAVNHDKYMDMANYFTNNNFQLSQDLVQDMYLTIGERLTRIDKKPIEYITLGYCFRAIKYQFFKYEKEDTHQITTYDGNNQEIKVRTKSTVYAEDLEGYEFEDGNDPDEEMATFKKFLNQVPHLNREVLIQHQYKTQRQIQSETGVCRDRLRKLKNRGLEKLTAILEENNFKPKLCQLKEK